MARPTTRLDMPEADFRELTKLVNAHGKPLSAARWPSCPARDIRVEDIAHDLSISRSMVDSMATAISRVRDCRVAAHPTRVWAKANVHAEPDPRDGDDDRNNSARGNDALEHPHEGQGRRAEPGDRQKDMVSSPMINFRN